MLGRGSLGFGEDALQSLPGNIGTNDVADCIAALDLAVAEGKPSCFARVPHQPQGRQHHAVMLWSASTTHAACLSGA